MKTKPRKRPARILALPGSGHHMAESLRRLADRCEAGEVKCIIAVTLENDATTGFFTTGMSSMIQRLGLLDLARDAVLHDFEGE